VRNDKATRYLGAVLLVAAVILGAVVLLNYVIDPLWFFGGNKLQGRNFPFDERVARVAHFAASDRDFDCYIFGASRTGMMNEHDFKSHDCFMVSFENASPSELVAYAKYLKAHAKREPDLVIVGVDDFDFIDQADAHDLPAAVQNNEIPHFWEYYFSADVARWSLYTVFDLAPKPRYYGKDLTGQIRADAGSLPILRMKLEPGQKWHMSLSSVNEYAKFRQIFPKAHLVAYATPIAATRIRQFHQSGLLPFYLKALHATAAQFDEMYDFSIPSPVTADPHLSYDGSHYQPVVSDKIAAAIQNHEPSFGIVISGRSLDEITGLYIGRLALYTSSVEARADPVGAFH
jgi:hypothetical protein